MEETTISNTPEALYRERIFNMDPSELPEILEEVCSELIPRYDMTLKEMFEYTLNKFEIGDELDEGLFQKNYYRALHKISVINHKLSYDGMMIGEENLTNLIKINKLLEIYYYLEQSIRSLNLAKKASHPLYDSTLNTDIGLFRFKPMDPESNNSYQNLLLYLLGRLAEKGWRRQLDQCMERIYTKDKYDTHAWMPVMDIQTFVYSMTQKDTNFTQWYNLTQNPSNAKNAIKYLTETRDLHFIDVVKDRKLFSFPNGIYETSIWDGKKYIDRWYPHKTKENNEYTSNDICPKRSSCKYFEQKFEYLNEIEDWYDIPTPNFQRVLDYQKYSPDVCRWAYILFCGRLLHEVGDLDEWQVMPFLKGTASSGKCLGKGTLVMKYTGFVEKVEDIQVGDQLMGDDGTPRNVLCTVFGSGKLYKIKQENGDDYIVNDRHVLSLVNKTTVIDIPICDYLALDDNTKSKLKGFKVGLDFANSYEAAGYSHIYGEILICPYLYGLKFPVNNRNNIPYGYYIRTTREKRLKFLAGLIDSNGFYYNCKYILFQYNQYTTEDLVFLIRSLGYVVEISQRTSYKIIISGNYLSDIPVKCKRNKATNHKMKNCLHTKIEIEEMGEGSYYGFELDKNNRFLLGDFTVTHNSTILTKVCKEFFHTLDVGVLSNNCEKKFGLSAIKDKLLFIAPEIKGNIGLEQCDFQTIISGEETSIPEKFKTAAAIKWSVPGAMAGNEPPNYKDNQGSISRRLVVFNFKHKVKKGDTQLGKKLLKEIPKLIYKGNRAYIDIVNKYGKKDIWGVLPEYFKDTQKDMSEQTNSLVHFLTSDKLVFGEEHYCRQKIFINEFNNHVQENSLQKTTWKRDFYETPFDEYNIEVLEKHSRVDEYTGRTVNCNWLKGVNLVKRDQANDDLE
jgi:hypothetical protein